MGQLVWLSAHNYDFPNSAQALDDPNGLLAVGGDLSPERLLSAYRQGIFPWFNEGQPYLWWTPDPRMVLIPEELHTGRTTRKLLNKHAFTIHIDTAFETLINRCASSQRRGQNGTWITKDMQDAYCRLHKLGYAHSIEAWQGSTLVGGLYGVAVGKVFFGESMFSEVSGASKVAFISLASKLRSWNYGLIDCQMHTDYLESFGAREITRDEYEQRLKKCVNLEAKAQWSQSWME